MITKYLEREKGNPQGWYEGQKVTAYVEHIFGNKELITKGKEYTVTGVGVYGDVVSVVNNEGKDVGYGDWTFIKPIPKKTESDRFEEVLTELKK